MSASTTVTTALIVLVAGVLSFLVYQNRRLVFSSCSPVKVAQFQPSPLNDKRVDVSGLDDREIDEAIREFAKLYEMPHGVQYIVQRDLDVAHIRFPRDLEPRLFEFLVNYLHYFKGDESDGSSVVASGVATLSREFNLPSADLAGRRAVFYVPIGDRERDLLFVKIGDSIFENSFAGLCWRPMKESRIPPQVQKVMQ